MRAKPEYMEYKNYKGTAEVSIEDRCLSGQVLNISDLVIYNGETYDELEKSFHETIDCYLQLYHEIARKAKGE